jgi:hypothetical protein
MQIEPNNSMNEQLWLCIEVIFFHWISDTCQVEHGREARTSNLASERDNWNAAFSKCDISAPGRVDALEVELSCTFTGRMGTASAQDKQFFLGHDQNLFINMHVGVDPNVDNDFLPFNRNLSE